MMPRDLSLPLAAFSGFSFSTHRHWSPGAQALNSALQNHGYDELPSRGWITANHDKNRFGATVVVFSGEFYDLLPVTFARVRGGEWVEMPFSEVVLVSSPSRVDQLLESSDAPYKPCPTCC